MALRDTSYLDDLVSFVRHAKPKKVLQGKPDEAAISAIKNGLVKWDSYIYDESVPAAFVAGVKVGSRLELYSENDPACTTYEIARQPTSFDDAQSVGGTAQGRTGKEAGPKQTFLSPNADITRRVGAFHEWLSVDRTEACAFLLGELERDDIGEELRAALIFAAEAARFPTPEERGRLIRGLLTHAKILVASQRQGSSQLVCVALLRVGSIIPESDAYELITFLDSTCVDIRLATLQAIVRAFESSPPVNSESMGGLQDRIIRLASKNWDRDVFAAGDVAAVAVEAAIAAVTLRDERVLQILVDAARLKVQWAFGLLRNRIEDVIAINCNAAESEAYIAWLRRVLGAVS